MIAGKKRGDFTMKSLKTLQTLAKVGKVLSTIVFIVCIVGGALSIAAIVGLAVIPEGLKIGNTTFYGLIRRETGMQVATCYATMAAGIVGCAGEAVLAKFAQRYFKNELQAGTPFTFDGAKELIRLGILAICIPAGVVILSAIALGIVKAAANDASDVNFNYGASIGLGIMMIVAGLLCRHGAEVSAHTEEPKAE